MIIITDQKLLENLIIIKVIILKKTELSSLYLYVFIVSCLKEVRNVKTVHVLEVDTVTVAVQHRDTLAVVLQTGEQDGLLAFISPYFVLP